MGFKDCDHCSRAAGGRPCRRMNTLGSRCSHFVDRREREIVKKPVNAKEGGPRYLQYYKGGRK